MVTARPRTWVNGSPARRKSLLELVLRDLSCSDTTLGVGVLPAVPLQSTAGFFVGGRIRGSLRVQYESAAYSRCTGRRYASAGVLDDRMKALKGSQGKSKLWWKSSGRFPLIPQLPPILILQCVELLR